MSVSAVRVPAGRSQPDALEAWVDEAGNLVIPAAALPRDGRDSASVLVRHGDSLDPASLSSPRRGLFAVAAVSAVLIGVVAVCALHARQWPWTGFTGNTFHDWLGLMIAPFLLPLALKVVHILHVVHTASQRTAGPNDLIVKISAPR